MHPPPVPPTSAASWHAAAAQHRQVQRDRYQDEREQATNGVAAMGGQAAAAAPAQPQQFHSPPRGALLTAPPSPPPSRAPAPAAASAAAAASVSATAGYGAGAAPRPAAPRVKLYRNEEVILFRTPTDASHLVLFNLPSKPFLHPFYDLKTVAKARHEANEALCKEKAATAGATAVGANTGTGVPGSVAPAAAASSVSTAPAVTIRPPTFQPRPFGAAPAPPTAAQLCATYHALHLQNVERVLHHLSRKYGLVHELSLQCKPRDSGGDGGLSRYKRRRSLYPLGGFEDDEDDSDPAYAAIASFEAGFNLWAYLKYYSVLHAAHAAKELNRTELIKGQRIKAKRIQRNTPHTQSPVKPAQANTTAGAAVAAASASSTTSPIKSVPSVSPRVSYPLGHHRCLDLCNYFLGFNSWNCAIQQMRKYNHQSDEDIMDDGLRVSPMFYASEKENFANSWTATVLIEIAGQSFCCSGVGHAASKEGSSDAKKRAVTNAYRQLFASLALIILHNGKVAVRILP